MYATLTTIQNYIRYNLYIIQYHTMILPSTGTGTELVLIYSIPLADRPVAPRRLPVARRRLRGILRQRARGSRLLRPSRSAQPSPAPLRPALLLRRAVALGRGPQGDALQGQVPVLQDGLRAVPGGNRMSFFFDILAVEIYLSAFSAKKVLKLEMASNLDQVRKFRVFVP